MKSVKRGTSHFAGKTNSDSVTKVGRLLCHRRRRRHLRRRRRRCRRRRQ